LFDQRLRDIGLDIGEADREIGREREDLVDLGAGKGRDFRLFRRARGGRTVNPEMPTTR
jgi:hypothetical protein